MQTLSSRGKPVYDFDHVSIGIVKWMTVLNLNPLVFSEIDL